MVSVETYRCLYGNREGLWMIVAAPLDTVSPPTITVAIPRQGTRTLTSLGELSDVVTKLHNRFATGRAPVQAALAGVLGVTQQAVSRYMTGASRLPLGSPAWAALVRAWFDDTIVETAIAETRG
jgi:hypothetical protein